MKNLIVLIALFSSFFANAQCPKWIGFIETSEITNIPKNSGCMAFFGDTVFVRLIDEDLTINNLFYFTYESESTLLTSESMRIRQFDSKMHYLHEDGKTYTVDVHVSIATQGESKIIYVDIEGKRYLNIFLTYGGI